MKLLFVRDIQIRPVETVVLFFEGRHGVISSGGEDNEYWIRLLQRSLDRKQPVGIAFDKHGRITGVARADNDFVVQATQNREDELDVRFQGHDGTFHFRRDHPDFERIKGVLEDSIAENRRVWFVTSGPRLILVDIIWAQDDAYKK